MGSSAFYITDNLWGPVSEYTKCSSDFHEGGFKKLTDCKGRYLILRRTGKGMSSNYYAINEIRAFSVPNLLEGAAVIKAPTPKDLLLDAKNLVENFETRSSRQDFNAIIDWNGVYGSNRVVTRAT